MNKQTTQHWSTHFKLRETDEWQVNFVYHRIYVGSGMEWFPPMKLKFSDAWKQNTEAVSNSRAKYELEVEQFPEETKPKKKKIMMRQMRHWIFEMQFRM